jgi:hypothetical protein
MVLSSVGSSERPEPSARGRRATASRHAAPDGRAPADEALRLAVETLSAEICWFFAHDPRARGAVVAPTDPPSRRPRS